jgi:hypothetical protein
VSYFPGAMELAQGLMPLNNSNFLKYFSYFPNHMNSNRTIEPNSTHQHKIKMQVT